MKTLTLSKPMNLSRRKPRQRLTRAEIVSKTHLLGIGIDHTEHSELSIGLTMKVLKARYPVIMERKPLALKITKKIVRDRPEGWTKQNIRIAMRNLTGKTSYIENLAAEGSVRYRLDGEVAGEVSESHRLHAQRMLDKRYKENAPMVSRGAGESGKDSMIKTTINGGSIDD